jgi:hypothetical protein
MVESARVARVVDFSQLIDLAGLRRNSQGQMTSSSRSQHVREGEGLLAAVPGSRVCDEISCGRELAHEPDYHKGVCPVGKHGGTDNRVFPATLRFGSAQQVLGLSVGDLNAPTRSVSLDDLLGPSLGVRVEEDHVRVVAGRVMTEDNGDGLLPCAMIPERRELMDHQLGLFTVAKDLNLSPLQVMVLEHPFRGWQSTTSLARSAPPSHFWGFEKGEQGCVLSQPAGHVDIFGACFEDRIAAVAKVRDNPEAFSLFEPRMGQIDEIQCEFGFCLVGQTFGFNLGFRRPPQTSSVRQAKHAMADPGKTDRQSDDNEADSMPLLLRKLWE